VETASAGVPSPAEDPLVVDVSLDGWTPGSSPLQVSVLGAGADRHLARVTCDYRGFPLVDAQSLQSDGRGTASATLLRDASVALESSCQVEIVREKGDTVATRCWHPSGLKRGPCRGLPVPKSDGAVRVLDVQRFRTSKWMSLRIVALGARADSDGPKLTVKSTCVVGAAPLVTIARYDGGLPSGERVLPGQATARVYEFAPVWQESVEAAGAYRCPVTISFEGALVQEGCMTKLGYEPLACPIPPTAAQAGEPLASRLRFGLTEDEHRIRTVALRGDVIARRPIRLDERTVSVSVECWRHGRDRFTGLRLGDVVHDLAPPLKAGLEPGEVVGVDAEGYLPAGAGDIDCCALEVSGRFEGAVDPNEPEWLHWSVIQRLEGRQGRCDRDARRNDL
jgi:hypothetical protein